jgi:hypothetical protein
MSQKKCKDCRVFCDLRSSIFRCEEHLYTRLRWSVGRSVCRSVPHDARLRGKLELRRDCFEKSRRKRKLITWRFHYVTILSHLGIRRSPCFFIKDNCKLRNTFLCMMYYSLQCFGNFPHGRPWEPQLTFETNLYSCG